VLTAAPQLRLSNSVVGPVTVPLGANGPVQTLDASNIGDGALSLTLTIEPSATWLTATVGTPAAAIPLQFQLNTARLEQGTYTAAVTVADPHAVDSPQIITVTVRVGTSNPTSIDRTIAPGSSDDTAVFPGNGAFCFSPCGPGFSTTTQDGGSWLSIVVSQPGTIRFYSSYMIHIAPPPEMPNGDYHGSVTVTNSPDDRTIPVTMHVTRQPIAVPSTDGIRLRLAQGGPALTSVIALRNSGMGVLTVSGVTASGPGISVNDNVVTVNPGSLAPGDYNNGLVTFQCNAVNCPLQVPVHFTVVPPAPPVIQFRGVVNNATFNPYSSVSPGDVVVAMGEQLSLRPPDSAASAPLPTTLGGATVSVNGVLAPLYYSSFGQIDFQMPSGTAPGLAFVQVARDGQPGNIVSVSVSSRAPHILAVTDAQYHVLDLQHPAAPGDPIIVWAIGLGPTIPAVPDGALATTPASLATTPTVEFSAPSTRRVAPIFAGLGGGAVGLYQVNVILPQDAPPGSIFLSLHFPDAGSEAVSIGVK
jgi:uncharacterized protein (TIGR03437 family)